MDRVNQWLTLLANIGVLVGIIFLIVEVRQNTTGQVSAAYQERSTALEDLAMRLAESEVLSRIQANLMMVSPGGDHCLDNATMGRYCFSLDEDYFATLTAVEKTQFKNYLLAHLVRINNLTFQYQQGLLAEEYHDAGIIGAIDLFMPMWELFDLRQREGLVQYRAQNAPDVR